MAATGHHAHTTTHDDTMAPANNGLRISKQHVIHLVLTGKKVLCVRAGPTRIFNRGATQLMNIAARTERFLTLTIDINCGNRIVLSPFQQFTKHDFYHLGIE